MEINRVIIIVLDSVGVGALPDAGKYGDEGSNTLGNTARAVGGLHLPQMQKLGLGNIIEVAGAPKVKAPEAAYGKMSEKSAGKDTTTGHWELMGLITVKPFPTYPEGFPDTLIKRFEQVINTKTLGNKPASGTEIIKELGEKHLRTGYPIVYTSADSVFQIAAHEKIIPPDKLYEICKIAREEILVGEHAVGRVIARPFIGEEGKFTRTPHRKDFSLQPPDRTVLDYALQNNLPVYGVGKIGEIFSWRGITECPHIDNNMEGIDKTLRYMKSTERGIIFTNLVDFDMLWGHRNNFRAYAKGLEAVDARLPEILKLLKSNDVLILTADHGCDPTTASTDHSREYVPLIICGNLVKKGVNLGIRESFADVGKTVAGLLGFEAPVAGKNFVQEIIERP